MSTKAAVLLLLVLIMVAVRNLYSQKARKSHEQCLKLVPGDWGPNFGAEWHDNEARYWACRLGETPDTVRTWQKVAGIEGFMQDIVIASIDGTPVVLIEEIQGTAYCHIFTALSKAAGTWRRIWDGPERLPGEDEGQYCTANTGAIKVRVRGKELTLEIPDCVDANPEPNAKCEHVTWTTENYRWDGKTFVRLSKLK